ncbi:aldo/keto reductase [Adhaeribacter aquaticus]|uniref:aldo/keto reductase n=1 Tax=Adhaeribacter aquaticus TaxID=299567 RepID=UPI000410D21D|nr:aldo/keto reductase [Adhaeribacter aquaticus]
MEKRKLGNSGLEVAPLAFGGNVFGWTVDEANSFTLLDAFIEAGFNFIDTANSYSSWVPGNKGGESETIIGNWVKQRSNRDKIIIATKVGSDMGQGHKVLKKHYILQAVEESLQRLRTDYIDLYQSHYDDLDTPIEETLEAYAQLIKEGKVRAIGASNFSPERLNQAIELSQTGLPRYETLQPEYNLYDREEYEKELEPLCLENNIGVISYFSLASGFLTGKYRSENDLSKSQRGGGVKKYLNERGFRILQALDEVAEDYNSDPASVSLAWLIARPSITAPIASATSLGQLQSLIKAAELKLDNATIEKLARASAY